MEAETTIETLPDDLLRTIFSVVDHAFPIVLTCRRWWKLMEPQQPHGSLTIHLCDAAAKGYTDLMDMYRLEGNPDTNEALKAAAGAGQLMTMRKLFRWGAVKTGDALCMAARQNQPEAIEVLLQRSTDGHKKAMEVAAEYGSEDAMKKIYSTRGPHWWGGKRLAPALNSAASAGQLGALELLRDWKASDFSPYCPVMCYAAGNGRVDAMEKLHDWGYGGHQQALRSAAEHGQVFALQKLLDWGTESKEEAMVQAASYGKYGTMGVAYRYGASNFNDALLCAAANERLEAMETLRRWGATDFEGAMEYVPSGGLHGLLEQWIKERDFPERFPKGEDFYRSKARRTE